MPPRTALSVYSPTYSTFRMPESGTTAIREFYNKLMGNDDIIRPEDTIQDQREGIVHTIVESGATGAALGVAHSQLPDGLDIKVGGLTAPIDAVLGAIAVISSKAMEGKVGRSIHAIGDRAIGIWAFRSTVKLLAAKSASVSSEMSADPLTEAAKHL